MKKICALKFFNFLKKNGIEFFCGVPDSVLKSILKVIQNKVSEDNHVIVSNEGNSIGLACGYYLATKKLAIFDAFEILNRIQEEENILEGKDPEEKKERVFKGFAEGRSK